jgi:hypothetical protein
LDFKINHKLLKLANQGGNPEANLVKSIPNSDNKVDLNLFHKRLNHINKDYLIKSLNIKSSDIKSDLNHYESCEYRKFHEIISRKPSDIPDIIYKLEKFSIDIAGSFKISGLKGEKYFLTFSD